MLNHIILSRDLFCPFVKSHRAVKNITFAAIVTVSTASFVAAPIHQAEAFGLGDITGAVSKGVKAVGGEVKRVGKDIGRSTKYSAKKVGGTLKKGATVVGKAGEKVGKVGLSMGLHAGKTTVRAAQGARDISLHVVGRATITPTMIFAKGYLRASGQWNAETRESIRQAERDWIDAVDNAGDKMDRGVRRIGRATSEFIRTGGVTSGESSRPLPQKISPLRKRLMEQSLRNHVNNGGLKKPIGVAKIGIVKNKPIGNTMVELGYNKNAKRRPLGITKDNLGLKSKRKPLGHDKSVWGRPVGVKKTGIVKPGKMTLGVVKDNSFKRSIGITKDNLGLKGNRKPLGRDKSVWGRPVGKVKPIGRDKSRWGRPIGQVKLGVVKDKSFKRPITITKRKLGVKNTRKQSRKLKFQNKKRNFQGITKRDLKANKKAKRFNNKKRSFKRSFSKQKRFQNKRNFRSRNSMLGKDRRRNKG